MTQIQINPLHHRIGTGNGYFPNLERGGSLGLFACPCAAAALPHEAGGIVLYLTDPAHKATLTAQEARDLAASLLQLADKLTT